MRYALQGGHFTLSFAQVVPSSRLFSAALVGRRLMNRPLYFFFRSRLSS